MTVSQRWQWPSVIACGSLPTSRFSAVKRARTALRASKRSRPANSPASAVIFPSGPITTTDGKPCRCPAAKSLTSCAGVTFTIPVPNSRSTRIPSSITGSSRPTIGRTAVFPRSFAVRGSSG